MSCCWLSWATPPNFVWFGSIRNELQIFEILSCTSFVEWRWCKNITLINCNLLPNLLKLIKFGVIVQKDELRKIINFSMRSNFFQWIKCYVISRQEIDYGANCWEDQRRVRRRFELHLQRWQRREACPPNPYHELRRKQVPARRGGGASWQNGRRRVLALHRGEYVVWHESPGLFTLYNILRSILLM